MLYVTTGYNFSIAILAIGVNSLDSSKQVVKMTIEKGNLKVYKETELSIHASPYGAFGRISQVMSWTPPNKTIVTLEPIDVRKTVLKIDFELPKSKLTHRRAKAAAFQSIDNFWDLFVRFGEIKSISAIRLDSFIRKEDIVAPEQRLLTASFKSNFLGDVVVKCPACEDALDLAKTETQSVEICPCCNRVFLLNP